MRSSHSVDRLDTTFDDNRLVADERPLLPATLAQHLGVKGMRRRNGIRPNSTSARAANWRPDTSAADAHAVRSSYHRPARMTRWTHKSASSSTRSAR